MKSLIFQSSIVGTRNLRPGVCFVVIIST